MGDAESKLIYALDAYLICTERIDTAGGMHETHSRYAKLSIYLKNESR